MNRPARGSLLVPVYALITLLTTVCSGPQRGPAPAVTERTARLVQEIPAGTLAPDSALRVRFAEPVQPAAAYPLVGAWFTLEPPVTGTLRWVDDRTLEFAPAAPLVSWQRYQVRLDLPALLPAHKGLDPLQWELLVPGREVAALEHGFQLVHPDDPASVRFQGQVTFTTPVALALVQRAAGLWVDDEAVALDWRGQEQSTRFEFASQPIARRDSARPVRFELDARVLELSAPVRQAVELPPLRTMAVHRLRQQNGERLTLIVEFTDALDRAQDLAGLITVKPPVPVTLRPVGQQVIVQGDFRHGQDYELLVYAGVRSRWGTRTTDLVREPVSFADRRPGVRFARDGVFLPSAENRRLRFSTLNLSHVKLTIKRVYPDNLGQFLQTERLSSERGRHQAFRDYFVSRVGVQVAHDTLLVAGERNTWLQHELDLRGLIEPDDQGLYLVSLHFDADDMQYGSAAERAAYERQPRRFSHEDYFNNPFSPGYLHVHGRVYKALVCSDIGLTAKRAGDRYLVWATAIEDTRPLSGVAVSLRSMQNQILKTGSTDATGLATFAGVESEVLYVEAVLHDQRSFLKPDEMEWRLSAFDTGGQRLETGGTRTFIYTERGVYRPGDTVHVAVLARHADHTFPEEHPLTLTVFNARDQRVYRRTSTAPIDGLYAFAVPTEPDAPTGNWRIQVRVGGEDFEHPLKVETVAPQPVEVTLEATPQQLNDRGDRVNLALSAAYFFGVPVKNAPASISVDLVGVPRRIAGYEDYTFDDAASRFEAMHDQVMSGATDSTGAIATEWRLPSLERAPAQLQAVFTGRVTPSGSRPAQQRLVLPVDPYRYYVGMLPPALEYGTARVGRTLRIPVVLVDADGVAVSGQLVDYRIYRGDLHWWWEYEDRDQAALRFRSARSTELVDAGTLTTTRDPVTIPLNLDAPGQYLVQALSAEGHVSSCFVRAQVWGEALTAAGDAGLMTLTSDAEVYAPGDVARIRFPLPPSGAALVTVEQGDEVKQAQWYPVTGAETEATVAIPVTPAMAPNAYVAVSVLQPYAQTANDRPLRLYGVLPLLVEDPQTRLGVSLETPPFWRPENPFAVELQTEDRQPAAFTLAVVDQGLLALTGHRTPDPWQAFYGKTRLSVRTFDLFAQVIGAHRGDVFRTFAIGGSLALMRQLDQEEVRQLRRFPPVSLFRGPLRTDERGYARVELDMPNYVGAVRVMAVAARGRQYGHAERVVPVRSELMLVPALPRVLGPEDRFTVPVTVLAMEDGLGPVEVRMDVRGPVAVEGAVAHTVSLERAGEAVVAFDARVEAAVGVAEIHLTASAGQAQASHTARIEVRPSAPVVYREQRQRIAPGDSVALNVPDDGIEGEQQVRLLIQRGLGVDLHQRARTLLQWPYGNIEQTVSAAFPQLYLSDLLPEQDPHTGASPAETDAAIHATLERLPAYRQPDGSFAVWPGGSQVSPWSSLYTGHFMLAAAERGYHVPPDLRREWLDYEQSQALTVRDELLVRVYRAYLLARVGEPSVAAMNLLREHALTDMQDVERWLLAAAYQRAGMTEAAVSIARETGTRVSDYRHTGPSYGSVLRDQALILLMLLELDRLDRADTLAAEIAAVLSTDSWHSSQALSFALLGLSQYEIAQQKPGRPHMIGTVQRPDGRATDFDTAASAVEIDIGAAFGETIQVTLDRSSRVERVFAVLTWEGVPLRYTGVDEARYLELDVQWLDLDGQPLDPEVLQQGTRFWGHFQVHHATAAGRIEDIALMQILPAGWELEDARLESEHRPRWAERWNLGRQEHTERRDDRVIWFFALDRNARLDFLVPLTAVTAGAFHLPPARVEAMYDHRFRATRAGRAVRVAASADPGP